MEIKIYLVNLRKKYNNGEENYGKWLTLPMEQEKLAQEIKAIAGNDDYAIHDYEAPLYIDEYASPFELNELLERFNDAAGNLDEREIQAILEYADSLEEAVEGLENGEIQVHDLGKTYPDWSDLAYYLADEFEYIEGLLYEELKNEDFDTVRETVRALIQMGLIDFDAVGSYLEFSGRWHLSKNGIAVAWD